MFVMRFAHLTNGLQYDELYSAITASPKLSFAYIWQHMLLKDVNLPLFNVLLFGWNRLFPFTDMWMHFFSALLGALAVVAAWICAPKYWTLLKKCMYVTLLSCSFILVAYGAIVRTYSLAVLLTVVFSLLALRLIDGFSRGQQATKTLWMCFYGAGLAGAYSHYFCSGLFFITALVVFLYACYYKTDRAWAFWGTAVVFGLWSFWLIHTVCLMSSPSGSWWFITPVAKATYDTLVFLLGPQQKFTLIIYIWVGALISWVFTYRRGVFKQADVVLPLAQICLLLGVVALVSQRYNLWLDRYFLPVMPAILLLFAGLLDHLRQRCVCWLLLWPLLLVSWVQFYWDLEHLHWPEYTGLRAAFTHLVDYRQEKRVLLAMENTGYPEAALLPMFDFYVPKDKEIEMIPYTPQTASLAWQTQPKTPILMILCSQMHLMHTSFYTNTEEDGEPYLFGRDVCIYTAHPIASKEKNS